MHEWVVLFQVYSLELVLFDFLTRGQISQAISGSSPSPVSVAAPVGVQR